MNKGEIYFIYAAASFAAILVGLIYLGAKWYLALAVAIVPAIYFAIKSAKWAEGFADDAANRIIKRMNEDRRARNN